MKYAVRQLEEGKHKTYIHADHPFNDYTLCGLALEGMGRDSRDEHEAAINSKGKINCQLCISLIRHCKEIKL